jgi:hypothetical protein
LLAFVKRFGLLGRTVLSGTSRRRDDGHLYMADDMAWVLQHARNVDRILQLSRSRWTKLDDLLEFLDLRTVRVREIGQDVAEPMLHLKTLQVPVLTEPWQIPIRPDALMARRTEPLDVSRQIIAELLNPNLIGVQRAYDPTADAPTFQFRALIQMVYWPLADRLGHYAIRQCRCGAMFFAPDERQDSHSKKCYRRFYMQDHRKGRLRRRKTKRTSKKGRRS